jgi:hypothetical protein
VLKISSSEKTALPNFLQSREKASGAETERSARSAASFARSAARSAAGFALRANRRTRVSNRDGEKSAGFSTESVENHQKCRF